MEKRENSTSQAPGQEDSWSIAQVSQMFSLPASTLRYYEQRQIIPPVEKVHGVRRYSKIHIEVLRLVECMKACGATLEDIRSFMQLCIEGNPTLKERAAFMEKLQNDLEQKMQKIEKQLKMAQFKTWYYKKAAQLDDELAVVRMIPSQLPPDILELYEQSHTSLYCKGPQTEEESGTKKDS